MINKKQIENILSINGVDKASPDEEIKSVLISAKFKNEEVDAALMVLRENTKTKKTRVDGLHKVFRSDEALNSQEISQLLGIDVDLPSNSDEVPFVKQQNNFQLATIMLLSVILALLGILMYMYVNQMGVFFDPAA